MDITTQVGFSQKRHVLPCSVISLIGIDRNVDEW
jgi:hypothetical protein